MLTELVEHRSLDRSGIVVCSKGGYIATRKLGGTVIDYEHSLKPQILRQQIDESRSRLQLETIDIYFVHNPEEYLLRFGRGGFKDGMLRVFECLENAVRDGQIGAYGVASADGFRVAGPCHHSLDKLVGLAEQIGGRRLIPASL